jgi:hypothetical protein
MGGGQQRIAFTKVDSLAWAYGLTSGSAVPVGAAVTAKVTFDRVMVHSVVSHGAVRARHNALTATHAEFFHDVDDTRDRVFCDGLWVYWAGAQACRTLAVLASECEKGQVRFASAELRRNLCLGGTGRRLVAGHNVNTGMRATHPQNTISALSRP